MTFGTVAGQWLARFETMVAVGERRERTLESHRYHLTRHLVPVLRRRRIAALTVDDIADLIRGLVAQDRAPRTITGALATLGSILRYALRRGYSPTTRSHCSKLGNVRGRSPACRARSARTRSHACWPPARRATDC